MKFKRLAVLISGIACSASLHAEDLLQLYREAQGYDAQYASARAQRDATLQREPQARAGLLPNIGASANTTWNDQDIKYRDSSAFSSGKRQYNSNGYNLQLSQPLFRWQNWVQLDQAKLQAAQAEAQLVQARQDLVLRVAQAYFDVLLAQDALETIGAQKKATAEQLASAKRNFEVGTATITDTHEAQAKYDLVIAQEIAAQNDLEVKRRTLAQVVGREPSALNRLKEKLDIPRPAPDNIDQWVETARKNASAVQVAQAGVEIAGREVDRQRAGHYPTLDAVASYGKTGAGSGQFGVGTDVTSGSVGLQLAIPLYQGGGQTARQREAEALRDKALADLDNATRLSMLAARQSFLGVTSGVAQVKALEAAMVSNQSSLDANRLGYDVGVRINIDVLNAQQQLYTTRRDLAKARYDSLLAQLKLKNAVGSLSEKDLDEINVLLVAPGAAPASGEAAPAATTAPVAPAGRVAPKSVQPKVPANLPDVNLDNPDKGRRLPAPRGRLPAPGAAAPTPQAASAPVIATAGKDMPTAAPMPAQPAGRSGATYDGGRVMNARELGS